jgi:hypothetical protein
MTFKNFVIKQVKFTGTFEIKEGGHPNLFTIANSGRFAKHLGAFLGL